jgi:hypothetical protein
VQGYDLCVFDDMPLQLLRNGSGLMKLWETQAIHAVMLL